ncbi:hypothetical protein TNCV_1120101 [Trichonephila clavipes]|uniref:Tc1-like transposase DDE domain-containing protein n=1 Tax=Trichonephila clavipes TaxID=2585209 RepID=A0A8X6SZ11_TRICX|nr:hypothetical protein TNCV_1120101 [Trichonephila clavipes]
MTRQLLVTIQYGSGNKINVLNWPGNSPDLNPIENLWHILKNRSPKMSCTTTEEMIKSAIQVCCHDDEVKSMCTALVYHEVNIVVHISY